MGHQLFSGWYQMILDVFRCSQLFSDVFSWVVRTFFLRMPSIDCRYSIEILRCVQDVLRCPQMFADVRCSGIFSDDHRCFWIFSRYSFWWFLDVLLMFSGCLQDFPGFFHFHAPMGLVDLAEFNEHFKWKNQPWWFKGTQWSPTIGWTQLFDEPQLFHYQLEVWTLTIQKSTVIYPSLTDGLLIPL